MSDSSGTERNGSAPTAGGLLREARQARGLHLAALAISIKIAPEKLEALEADRYDALFNTAFTRALAQTVCRALKIDAAPVLALLPAAQGHRLEQLGEGLNTPFRDHPMNLVPRDWTSLTRVAVWGPALLLLAALLMYAAPPGALSLAQLRSNLQAWRGVVAAVPSAVEPAATTVSVVLAIPGAAAASAAPAEIAASPADTATSDNVATAMVAEATVALPAAAGAASAVAPDERLLQVQTAAVSWVEVIDARGKALLSRLLQPGESVALDGTPPLQVRIGNAADTRLVFRGEPLELGRYTRNNLARLELK